MKLSVLAGLVTLASSVTAFNVPYFQGINMGSQRTDNSCKTAERWDQELAKISSWRDPSGNRVFNNIKLFSTADCNQLDRAIPAAIKHNMKIWAGVWAVDQAKFDREKGALEAAILKYGTGWLLGINVGSESLYRKEIDPNLLARHIYDVKGMVQIAYKAASVPVGTADTWTMWVDGRNRVVIEASDVIIMNAFPYWQGVPIQDGLSTLQKALTDTRAVVNTIPGGAQKTIVIGETGWPDRGENFGAAVPNIDNLRSYFSQVYCWITRTRAHPWMYFSAFDETQKTDLREKSFGVAWSGQTLKVSFNC